jgi:predicted metal-dependent hydrolase
MMVAMEVKLENNTIEVHVEYGKREKVSIHINSIGFITVKAPKNTADELIIKAIEQQGKWILEHLNKIDVAKKISKTKEYQAQGKFLFLGKEYLLSELISTDGLEEEELKINLKKFYTVSCKKVVSERINIYQQQLRVKPKSFEIVESSTKWGSCNSDKKITFNYRLAMAPVEVIDYVIVHELCHLVHMNHDRSFWRLVGSVQHDYKKKESYLTRYGQYMTL